MCRHFVIAERLEVNVGNAAGERLTTLMEQIRRCRPQHEESPRPAVAINQGTEQWEKVREALHLINTDRCRIKGIRT